MAASCVPSVGSSVTWGSYLVYRVEEVLVVVDNQPVLDMKKASDSQPVAEKEKKFIEHKNHMMALLHKRITVIQGVSTF